MTWIPLLILIAEIAVAAAIAKYAPVLIWKYVLRKPLPSTTWRSFILRTFLAFVGLIAIGVIIAVLGPVTGAIRHAKITKTRNMLIQIDVAFRNYVTEYDVPPPGKDPAAIIENLMEDNPRHISFLYLKPQDRDAEGRAVDPWGTPISIAVVDSHQIWIGSAGPDKAWQTPDDIDVEKVRPASPAK